MPTPDRLQTGQELRIHDPFGFKWAEYISSPQGSTQSYQLQTDNSQSHFTIDIDGEDFRDTIVDPIGQILGYSFAYTLSFASLIGSDNRYLMSRVPPAPHPLKPWMFAVSAGPVQGLSPTGIVAPYDIPLMGYARYRVPITYSSLNYNVVTDDRMAMFPVYSESNRYVIKTLDTSADSIAIDGTFFRFAEGPYLNPLTQQFTLGQSKILVKVNLTWTWVGVPERYLFDSNGIATNINAALGTVNSAEVWGYPAGTLLMLPAKFTPRMLPVSPYLLGPLNPIMGIQTVPRVWDVQFQFKYWDPPTNPAVGPNRTRGHNTALWVADQLFYLIKSAGYHQLPLLPPNGQPLFASTDFLNVFKGVVVNS